MVKVKFSKEYVDSVFSMFFRSEDAKKFLLGDLFSVRNKVSRDHYTRMYEYIVKHN